MPDLQKSIFTLPPGTNFLKETAAYIWEKSRMDPLSLSEMLVLLPTRRACRELKLAFIDLCGQKAALLPRMHPLGEIDEAEDFFARGAHLEIPPAIPHLRRQMVLAQLVRRKDPTLPHDQAAQLAASLAALIDQMQIDGLDFSCFHQLQSELAPELAEHWQKITEFLQIASDVWPKLLAAENNLDPATRRNLVLAAEAALWKSNPPPFPIFAAGSTGSVPNVAALMAVVAQLPQGCVILPGLDQNMSEEDWQAVSIGHPQFYLKNWLEKHACFPRKSVSLLNGAQSQNPARVRLLEESQRPAEVSHKWQNLSSTEIPATAAQGLHLLEVPEHADEATVIALHLRAILQEPTQTAMVITPDRKLSERISATLKRWNITANSSDPQSLATFPNGTFLSSVLTAARPEASAADFLTLLKHPLASANLGPALCRFYARRTEVVAWRGAQRKGGWCAAAAALQQANQPEIANWLMQLARCFQPFTDNWQTQKTLPEWITLHLQTAEFLADHFSETTNPSSQQIFSKLWQGEAGETAAVWFDEWREAGHDYPPLKGAEYARLFQQLLGDVKVKPASGGHPRIKILGPLEARLLCADHTIIASLNEGNWPPSAQPDPWLSRPMREAVGLPLPEWRVGLSAHDFIQLAAGKTVLLTRARRTGGSPTVPSRFWLQLQAVSEKLAHQNQHAPHDQHTQFNQQTPAQLNTDHFAACRHPAHFNALAHYAKKLDEPAENEIQPCSRPCPSPPLSFRPRSLPVTEITKLIRNPYAIYANYILNLQKLDDLDQEEDVSDRGTLLHRILEKFTNSTLANWPLNPLELLIECGREEFLKFQDRPQIMAYWWPTFLEMAKIFISSETMRREMGFWPIAAEISGQMHFPDPLNFVLRGKLDRLDKANNQDFHLIDYKTGSVPNKHEVMAGWAPQLPLLSLMLQHGAFAQNPAAPAALVNGLYYWSLNNSSNQIKNPQPKNIVPSECAPLLREKALEGLQKLILAFNDPATPYSATPHQEYALQYDNYAHLARAAEWSEEEQTE